VFKAGNVVVATRGYVDGKEDDFVPTTYVHDYRDSASTQTPVKS